MTAYTVIGLLASDDWGDGLYEATFVEHVEAQGPIEAASVARCKMAESAVSQGPGDYVVLAVFEGHLTDVYDAELDTN